VALAVRPAATIVVPSTRTLALVAVIVGVSAGLLANSGGFLLAPLMMTVVRLPIRQALATSLAVSAVLAVPGTIVHAALGHIDWTLVAVFAANNASGVGAARAIKDNNAVDRIPVTSFDTDAQEVAGLQDGSLDTLVVQNPYFFGYQGVLEAASAAAGTLQPDALDPGAVFATKQNMNQPSVKQLLTPPTAKAQ